MWFVYVVRSPLELLESDRCSPNVYRFFDSPAVFILGAYLKSVFSEDVKQIDAKMWKSFRFITSMVVIFLFQIITFLHSLAFFSVFIKTERYVSGYLKKRYLPLHLQILWHFEYFLNTWPYREKIYSTILLTVVIRLKSNFMGPLVSIRKYRPLRFLEMTQALLKVWHFEI